VAHRVKETVAVSFYLNDFKHAELGCQGRHFYGVCFGLFGLLKNKVVAIKSIFVEK
jgi:hypothetical protein